jgi:hypothetical protein
VRVKSNQILELNGHAILPFNSFLVQTGRSASCGWRWRRKGWITTIDIAGRLYISQQEIERFQKRAAAGEFAKKTHRLHASVGREAEGMNQWEGEKEACN